MSRFWKWLMFGPPLRTEPCLFKVGTTWYLSLPQIQDVSAKAVRKVLMAWAVIALLGFGVLIAADVSPKLREYINSHNPRLIGGCGLALVVAGFVLSLRFSRERKCKEIIVDDHIGSRWYKIFFGFDWIQPDKSSTTVHLNEVKAIWRYTSRIHANTFAGKERIILECDSDNMAQWVYSRISERLVQSNGLNGIRWISNQESIIPQYDIDSAQTAPWNVIESPEHLEIVFPTPTRVPLSDLLSSINWGKRYLKVGAIGMLASLIGVLAVQILARLWPQNSMELFSQVAIVPYLALAFATIITFFAYHSVSDGNKELPAKTRATQRITTRVIADINGLTRTNALNEELRIEGSAIQQIQYDLRISESNGESSSYYDYTLNADLISGDKVFLLEYGSDEKDESLQLMNSLVMRLEQSLNLPLVSSTKAPAS